jgi:hypothetical protein
MKRVVNGEAVPMDDLESSRAAWAAAREAAWRSLTRVQPVSVPDAYEYTLRFCDSYSRRDALHRLRPYMHPADMLELAGKEWCVMDDAWRAGWLVRMLRDASLKQRMRFMSDHECHAWKELPDVVTAYRGCYTINRRGVSFSLSRSIAEGFPFLRRYRIQGDTPLLLEVRARRSDVLLKLERTEQEVVVLYRSSVRTVRFNVPGATG